MSYNTDLVGEVLYVEVAELHEKEGGVVTFFAVNRHPAEALGTSISLQGFGPGAARLVDHQAMRDENLTATNTLERPDHVAPRPGSGALVQDGEGSSTYRPVLGK